MIVGFVDQTAQVIGIHCTAGQIFDRCPSRLFDFGRCVSLCVRNNASKRLSAELDMYSGNAAGSDIYQDDRAFLFHGAQQLESSQLPLACFVGEDGSDSDISVHQIAIVVQEFDGVLMFKYELGWCCTSG